MSPEFLSCGRNHLVHSRGGRVVSEAKKQKKNNLPDNSPQARFHLPNSSALPLGKVLDFFLFLQKKTHGCLNTHMCVSAHAHTHTTYTVYESHFIVTLSVSNQCTVNGKCVIGIHIFCLFVLLVLIKYQRRFSHLETAAYGE